MEESGKSAQIPGHFPQLRRLNALRLLLAFGLLPSFPRGCISPARQDLKSFEQRITTKVLPNGLTLIICERHDAPVFSYTTFIDAGDVNDPSGESGLAHMFEHLAFKGTTQIGTTDYASRKSRPRKRSKTPTMPTRPST